MMNIPSTRGKRIVIVGCGFAGLNLAKKLKNSGYQVVILDKHNYHQFPPLFYQVASAGLEASSILFPIRKVFQGYKDLFIRKAEVKNIDTAARLVNTTAGEVSYDYLVISFGATNSFFGSKEMEKNSNGMKTIAEVLDFRNTLLMNFEEALTTKTQEEKQQHLNIVIVGGGPSGVEISGALSEMNHHVIPKDFPELRNTKSNIYLIEAADRVLNMMSEKSSRKAREFLEQSGVKVLLNTKVTGSTEHSVFISPGEKIDTSMIIWTAGIKGNHIEGLDPQVYTKGERIITDRYSRVKGYDNVFALGDVAFMIEEKYPKGHPQVAQVAIQQGKLLAGNLISEKEGKPWKEFRYRDLGTMATVGRNLAVVELPFIHFHGIFAWYVWMFIHLMAIVGVKNKLMIFINWAWKYVTYDQSFRLILRPKGCT
jgi:NADH:ubiquinone reductase (H+-translocating)